jgi:hypothetical protein
VFQCQQRSLPERRRGPRVTGEHQFHQPRVGADRW